MATIKKKLITEEQLLLKDIFLIRIYPDIHLQDTR